MAICGLTYGHADEVLLKNDRLFVNVNIVQHLETEQTITIFTSMRKKIDIEKENIKKIKLKKFNLRHKSELRALNPQQVENFLKKEPQKTDRDPNYIIHKLSSEVPLDSILRTYPDMRLNVEGGYSYRRGEIPDDMPNELQNYLSDLKTGFTWSGDLTYFAFGEYGISLHYSRFTTSNYMSDIQFTNEFTGESVSLDDDEKEDLRRFDFNTGMRYYF
ncbi:MAG: hypothetical protein GF313_08570 [Caldithrix sp.]|nr:hypothetical protein [Caldithrix sp.]